MSNDLTKLPKWAQELITDLAFRRDQATEKLKNFLDQQTPSKIYVEELGHVGTQKAPALMRRYIVDANEVSFDITKRKDHPDSVSVRISHEDPSELIISSGWGGMAIHPTASNVIRIKTAR